MYVCLCQGVTDKQIKEALNQGAQDFEDVQDMLGVATQCGSCSVQAREIVNTHQRQSAIFYNAAAVA